MSFTKRLAFFLLASLICSVMAYALAWGNAKGLFIRWESLRKPPEKAAKIVSITLGPWVETESGQIFHRDVTSSCIQDCWTRSVFPEADTPTYFSLDFCGRMPSLDHAIEIKAVCLPWGPGSILYVYAIRDDGNVFVWTHGIGESGLLIFLPCVGALSGPLLILLIIFIKSSNSAPPPQPLSNVAR